MNRTPINEVEGDAERRAAEAKMTPADRQLVAEHRRKLALDKIEPVVTSAQLAEATDLESKDKLLADGWSKVAENLSSPGWR